MAGHRYPGSSYLPLQVLVQYSYPTTVDPLTDREVSVKVGFANNFIFRHTISLGFHRHKDLSI
jgi:hypothetical protein